MTTYEQSGIEVLSREVDNSEQSTNARESECVPLLVSLEKDKQGWRDGIKLIIQARYHRPCCLRSKAAILILLWNLIIVTSLNTFFDPSIYIYSINNISKFEAIRNQSFLFMPVLYGSSALLLLFYPLAGCLADTRWGRYKTVFNSLHIIFWNFIIMVFFGSIVAGYLLGYHTPVATVVEILESLSIPFMLEIVVIICGYVALIANVIQFGLDQLHDAPSDDSVLYVHWYVWTNYLGISLTRICISLLSAKDNTDLFYIIIASLLGIFLISMCILGATLFVHQYKRNPWHLIETGYRNPYKLVYKVIDFAAQHKNAVHRSAFTYCEDEPPSRLDLGKEKYGGPFTTEQVEDVKTFLGILCILVSLGPILMVDIAVSGIVTKFADQIDNDFDNLHFILIKNGGLSSLMITVLIPFYLCLLRPFFQNYIPGILKRIGLGMIFILLSALCTLSLDVYGHAKASNTMPCFASYTPTLSFNESYGFPHNIGSDILIIQCGINTIGYLFLYIAIYEFICAQSPQAMKGLLIGTFFAIKGVFQLLAIAIVYLPFTQWKWELKFPSCGFVYYFINVMIGFVGIVTYTCVARKYQYRQRDEPDNIYRYAEEYYAKAQDEPNYDYDDYDNLDIHTIN